MKVKHVGISHSISVPVERCVALLDKEYTALNYTIEFHQTPERIQYERAKKPIYSDEIYEQILNGKEQPAGQTIPMKKLIRLYLFNLQDIRMRNEEQYKIEIVANLFHEICHAYQSSTGLYSKEEEIKIIDGRKSEYLNLPSEREAYLFQEKQMNKHMLEISGILGVPKFHYKLKPEINEVIKVMEI